MSTTNDLIRFELKGQSAVTGRVVLSGSTYIPMSDEISPTNSVGDRMKGSSYLRGKIPEAKID